ncbi:NTP transferase domain-containing protein [Kytococcus sedentarius]|uniref:NTP transferase domain-containing protein n=1 Tax=Kytococcus sedentarius TaxID=1276 RepID=UPI00194F413D|nr:NTP transferase domain-containing protein [Kytococcus sedentarius]QRO86772.1 nucleotidyltransferase family protein [Kytococcus sedentarius]
MRPVVDAVVLAGGAGRRLGGVSKGEVELAGQRLVDHVLAATGAARQVVVVGDVPVRAGVLLTREDPPGGGPAAGVVTGLERLAAQPGPPADWVLLLACDLPGAGEVVPELLAAVEEAVPGGASSSAAIPPGAAPPNVTPSDARTPGPTTQAVVAVDGDGRPQWLLGAYRRDALAAAADRLGDPQGRPLRALVGELGRIEVRPAPAAVEDVDTWSDHARWTDRLMREEHAMSTETPASGASAPDGRAGHLPEEWRTWLTEVCAAFDLDPAQVDVRAVLDLTKEVAHGVDRPMAPVTAFVLGLALAKDPELSMTDGCERISAVVAAREGAQDAAQDAAKGTS